MKPGQLVDYESFPILSYLLFYKEYYSVISGKLYLFHVLILVKREQASFNASVWRPTLFKITMT